jgi:hypothetical protein
MATVKCAPSRKRSGCALAAYGSWSGLDPNVLTEAYDAGQGAHRIIGGVSARQPGTCRQDDRLRVSRATATGAVAAYAREYLV